MSRALKVLLSIVFVSQVAQANTPEVDVTVPHQATLSPDEMVRKAQEYRASMGEVLSRLEQMIEEAGDDIIKLNCLNKKVNEIKANIVVADEAMTGLQDAAKDDQGAIAYEYSRVSIANQSVQALVDEENENACAGEDLNFVGATQVQVKTSASLRTDDPTQPGMSIIDLDRPSATSPYL